MEYPECRSIYIYKYIYLEFLDWLFGLPHAIFHFKGKSWVPMGEYPSFLSNIYHLYFFWGGQWLYNGVMVQYGVMFWEQLRGYLPKGTQNFPLIIASFIDKTYPTFWCSIS